MPPPLNFPPVDGQPVHFLEAIRAAGARNVVLPDIYYGQLQGVARQLAFSIAGVASHDQLKAVMDSLSAWQANGKTFAQWQREAAVKDLELPRYRLENIFRTNLQGNYQAGHWEQIIRNQQHRPYLMYDAINDSRTRPAHRVMDNIIRPIDDVFWKTHSPPNGYMCRCGVISLTEAQAQARSKDGIGLNKGIDETKMQPDKGWGYSPRDRLQGVEQAAAKRLEKGGVLSSALDNLIKERQSMTDREWLKQEGKKILDDIIDRYYDPIKQHAELVKLLQSKVAMTTPAKAEYYGSEARAAKKWLESATTLLPDSWTEACDSFGKLSVRASKSERSRGWHSTIEYPAGSRVKMPAPFKVTTIEGENEGFLFIDARAESTALHEFCHRIQSACPELDAVFQEEHVARTAGEELQRLRDIYKSDRYRIDEVARKDKYINAYFGKEYGNRAAKEVMTMSIEAVLGVTKNEETIRRFENIMNEDRDLANLVVGLLLKWRPL